MRSVVVKTSAGMPGVSATPGAVREIAAVDRDLDLVVGLLGRLVGQRVGRDALDLARDPQPPLRRRNMTWADWPAATSSMSVGRTCAVMTSSSSSGTRSSTGSPGPIATGGREAQVENRAGDGGR